MRAVGWMLLLFAAFGFFAAIMGVRSGRLYQEAMRVDGTVTGHNDSVSGGPTRASFHQSLVHVAFVNPYTKVAEELTFENSGGAIDETRLEFPIGSTHNVWVTASGLRTCRAERPDALNGAPVLAGFGVLFGLIGVALLRRGRRA